MQKKLDAAESYERRTECEAGVFFPGVCSRSSLEAVLDIRLLVEQLAATVQHARSAICSDDKQGNRYGSES